MTAESAQASAQGKATDDLNKQLSKVFVGGLSWDTENETLCRYFESVGKVDDAFVMRKQHSGRSRGFGFVIFNRISDAETAVGKHVIDGRAVEVKLAVAREAIAPGTRLPDAPGMPLGPPTRRDGFGGGGVGGRKLFLGGVATVCTDDDVRAHFSQFGAIDFVNVVCDRETGTCRGFAFVQFASEDEAKLALNYEGNHMIAGARVIVKLAAGNAVRQPPPDRLHDRMDPDAMRHRGRRDEPPPRRDDRGSMRGRDGWHEEVRERSREAGDRDRDRGRGGGGGGHGGGGDRGTDRGPPRRDDDRGRDGRESSGRDRGGGGGDRGSERDARRGRSPDRHPLHHAALYGGGSSGPAAHGHFAAGAILPPHYLPHGGSHQWPHDQGSMPVAYSSGPPAPAPPLAGQQSQQQQQQQQQAQAQQQAQQQQQQQQQQQASQPPQQQQQVPGALPPPPQDASYPPSGYPYSAPVYYAYPPAAPPPPPGADGGFFSYGYAAPPPPVHYPGYPGYEYYSQPPQQ